MVLTPRGQLHPYGLTSSQGVKFTPGVISCPQQVKLKTGLMHRRTRFHGMMYKKKDTVLKKFGSFEFANELQGS
jgi:hypothetical protein